MQRLRQNPPECERMDDYIHGLNGLPASDVLCFWLKDKSKVVIRPSGTEPKVKIYLETDSDEKLASLRIFYTDMVRK